jgi:molybdopterin adenylyltransferase
MDFVKDLKGKIVAVCRSEKTGEKKEPCLSVLLVEDFGIAGDAHASEDSHRQVSLLAVESIEKMKNKGIEIGYGDFAENLAVAGLELHLFPPGTRLRVAGHAVLEVTQIGKVCHNKGCAIFRQVGTCIMPKEGIFSRVIVGGEVRAGDSIEVMKK